MPDIEDIKQIFTFDFLDKQDIIHKNQKEKNMKDTSLVSTETVAEKHKPIIKNALNEAADLIDEKGMCQGEDAVSPTGEICDNYHTDMGEMSKYSPLAALRHVILRLMKNMSEFEREEILTGALDYMHPFTHINNEPKFIWEWSRQTDASKVTETMRKCACQISCA